jgi:outer membrane protein OmpA-like peptidoglycan-associated protein
MNCEKADRSRAFTSGVGNRGTANFFIVALVSALLAACASPPRAPVSAPTSSAMTRSEMIRTSLKALDFEQRDDGFHLSLPAPVLFPFDSDVVATSARDTLIRVGRELQELGIDRALVRGHTDNVGTGEYNLALSKRRADAVAKVLVDGGYPAEKIDAKGLGFTVPVAENSTTEGRSKNRRVVIIVQLI